MRPNGIKLSRRHRMTVYVSFGALYLTGITWYVLHDDRAAAWFGNDNWGLSIQPFLLQIHGAAAMLVLLALGSLVPQHIKWAWKGRMNRSTGGLMVTTQALLVITGYALYYAGDEELRAYASQLHFAIGACIPVLLVWHILEGRRRSPAQRTATARARAPLVPALASANLSTGPMPNHSSTSRRYSSRKAIEERKDPSSKVSQP